MSEEIMADRESPASSAISSTRSSHRDISD